MCQDLPYNTAFTPNLLNHYNQQTAVLAVEVPRLWWAISSAGGPEFSWSLSGSAEGLWLLVSPRVENRSWSWLFRFAHAWLFTYLSKYVLQEGRAFICSVFHRINFSHLPLCQVVYFFKFFDWCDKIPLSWKTHNNVCHLLHDGVINFLYWVFAWGPSHLQCIQPCTV